MTTTLSDPTPDVDSPIAGEIVLEVFGGSRAGQQVRLRASRFSVGSGESCTLRLRARDVAPLHCWIIRGQQKTIVRRGSLDTRLNGRGFEEAELAAGDRLSCGPIELLVVDLGDGSGTCIQVDDPTDEINDQNQAAQFAERELWEQSRKMAETELHERSQSLDGRWAEFHARDAELNQKQAALDSQTQELQQRLESFRRDAEELEKARSATETLSQEMKQREQQLDGGQAEYAARDAELAAREKELQSRANLVDERTAQLETQWNDINRERAAVERLLEQWQQERQRAQCELDERTEACASREAELTQKRSDFDAERRQLVAEREATIEQVRDKFAGHDELAIQSQELFAARAELSSQREGLIAAQEALRAEREVLSAAQDTLALERGSLNHEQSQWAAREQRLVQWQAELEAQREDNERIRGHEAEPRDEPTYPTYSAESVESAESDETEETRESAPTLATYDESVAPPPQRVYSSEHEEEAAAIESYMTRLLGKPVSVAAPAVVVTHPAPNREMVPRDETTPTAERRVPTRSERPVAPERHADMSGMRALANENARHAIGRSRDRQQLRASLQRLAVTLVFTALGVWLGCMANVGGTWVYTLACLCAGFGIVGAVAQSLWMARRYLAQAFEFVQAWFNGLRGTVGTSIPHEREGFLLRPEPSRTRDRVVPLVAAQRSFVESSSTAENCANEPQVAALGGEHVALEMAEGESAVSKDSRHESENAETFEA